MNKCEIIENKKVKQLKYACLITDGYKVLAISLNNNLEIFKVSDLLLDESCDTIDISKRCNLVSVAYNIIGKKKDYVFLTRKEIKIRKYLINEFKNAYREKDINKLEYLYFEYFNKSSSEIEMIYEELINSLSKEITIKHIKLYELLKLCHQGNLSNLTN